MTKSKKIEIGPFPPKNWGEKVRVPSIAKNGQILKTDFFPPGIGGKRSVTHIYIYDSRKKPPCFQNFKKGGFFRIFDRNKFSNIQKGGFFRFFDRNEFSNFHKGGFFRFYDRNLNIGKFISIKNSEKTPCLIFRLNGKFIDFFYYFYQRLMVVF